MVQHMWFNMIRSGHLPFPPNGFLNTVFESPEFCFTHALGHFSVRLAYTFTIRHGLCSTRFGGIG